MGRRALGLLSGAWGLLSLFGAWVWGKYRAHVRKTVFW